MFDSTDKTEIGRCFTAIDKYVEPSNWCCWCQCWVLQPAMLSLYTNRDAAHSSKTTMGKSDQMHEGHTSRHGHMFYSSAA